MTNTNSRALTTPTTISALPAELWALIARHVEDKDLASLRAVSREAADKTRIVYGRRLFNHVSILPSSIKSLQQSLEIAMVFGPCIRRVTFFADELSPDWPARLHDKNAFGAFLGKSWVLKEFEHPIGFDDEGRYFFEALGTGKQMNFAAVRNILPSKETLMRQLFRILKMKGNTQLEEIAFTIMNHDHHPHSLSKLVENCQVEACRPSRPWRCGDATMSMVLSAMQKTAVSSKALVMGRDELDGEVENYSALPAHRIGANPSRLAPWQAVLQNVERLKLNLWSEPEEKWKVKSFMRLITSSAPKLKSLDLSLEFDDGLESEALAPLDDLVFTRLLLRSRMPALEELRLCNATFNFRKLMAFKKKNPGLRKLELHTVVVYNFEVENLDDERPRVEILQNAIGLEGERFMDVLFDFE